MIKRIEVRSIDIEDRRKESQTDRQGREKREEKGEREEREIDR